MEDGLDGLITSSQLCDIIDNLPLKEVVFLLNPILCKISHAYEQGLLTDKDLEGQFSPRGRKCVDKLIELDTE